MTELTYASPADEVRFTCGSWILDQPTTVSQQREPAKTLVITGFTCQTVTAFSGYQQLSTHTLPVSLSPVIAHTPEGAKISGRIVAAQYGDVLVVAGSDRFDAQRERAAGHRPHRQRRALALSAAGMDRRWACASPTCRAVTIRPRGTSLKARLPPRSWRAARARSCASTR